jgi:hypothetical protein
MKEIAMAFQYAVKFICGKTEDRRIVAPGEYWTAINVRNPSRDGIEFTKRVAVALPGEEAGPVSRGFEAGLGPGEALEIDRDNIFEHAGTGAEFLKGFVVIESGIELDVVAVYTAAGMDEQIKTLHIERVSPRT